MNHSYCIFRTIPGTGTVHVYGTVRYRTVSQDSWSLHCYYCLLLSSSSLCLSVSLSLCLSLAHTYILASAPLQHTRTRTRTRTHRESICNRNCNCVMNTECPSGSDILSSSLLQALRTTTGSNWTSCTIIWHMSCFFIPNSQEHMYRYIPGSIKCGLFGPRHWANKSNWWQSGNKRQTIICQGFWHVIDHNHSSLMNVVLGRWNKIPTGGCFGSELKCSVESGSSKSNYVRWEKSFQKAVKGKDSSLRCRVCIFRCAGIHNTTIPNRPCRKIIAPEKKERIRGLAVCRWLVVWTAKLQESDARNVVTSVTTRTMNKRMTQNI